MDIQGVCATKVLIRTPRVVALDGGGLRFP